MAARLGGSFVSIQTIANLFDEDLLGSLPDQWLMNSGTGVWPGGSSGGGTVYIGGTALTHLSNISSRLYEMLTYYSRWSNNIWAISTNVRGITPGYSEGGISTGPTSGHLELLHGTEAIIPLKNMSIPVQLLNGGSTRDGSDQPITINLQVVTPDGEITKEEVIEVARQEADNVRVKVERRPIGARRI